MRKTYLIYGIILCVFVAYSNYYGMDPADFTSGKWSPKGKQAYHK